MARCLTFRPNWLTSPSLPDLETEMPSQCFTFWLCYAPQCCFTFWWRCASQCCFTFWLWCASQCCFTFWWHCASQCFTFWWWCASQCCFTFWWWCASQCCFTFWWWCASQCFTFWWHCASQCCFTFWLCYASQCCFTFWWWCASQCCFTFWWHCASQCCFTFWWHCASQCCFTFWWRCASQCCFTFWWRCASQCCFTFWWRCASQCCFTFWWRCASQCCFTFWWCCASQCCFTFWWRCASQCCFTFWWWCACLCCCAFWQQCFIELIANFTAWLKWQQCVLFVFLLWFLLFYSMEVALNVPVSNGDSGVDFQVWWWSPRGPGREHLQPYGQCHHHERSWSDWNLGSMTLHLFLVYCYCAILSDTFCLGDLCNSGRAFGGSWTWKCFVRVGPTTFGTWWRVSNDVAPASAERLHTGGCVVWVGVWACMRVCMLACVRVWESEVSHLWTQAEAVFRLSGLRSVASVLRLTCESTWQFLHVLRTTGRHGKGQRS